MSELQKNNLEYQLNNDNAMENVITERRIINAHRKKLRGYLTIPEFIKPISIYPTELFDPSNRKRSDVRASVIRKTYKSLNVACIPITIPTEKDSPGAKNINKQIEMMNKLNFSRNFLKFYGISNTIGTLIMVNEWAELGNLKEVYDNYNISWNVKIQIALDICRGICFMHDNNILHHNLQCANIMMSEYCEPKITNLEFSCYMDKNSLSTPKMNDIIYWTAPEKIENFDKYKYDTKCEIFSFGMLLWELAFEKIPYRGWDVQEIKSHVLNGGRESLESINNGKHHEGYFEIIKNAWNQKPEDRDQFAVVLNILEQLAFSNYKNGISLNITPKFIRRSTTKPINELEARAKKWIKDAIEKKTIKSIAWSDFDPNSIEKIGEGKSGSVFKAYWTINHNYVAFKKLTISSDIQFKRWEAFRHEFYMQNRVDSCENIIRILGISDKTIGFEDEYYLIMEYADGGDLKNYLSKNFEKLNWNRKFELALDITNGLHFLHNEEILHRDLHAKNIVIHQEKAKIIDFGNSKSMNTATNIHDKLFSNIRYVAPEILRASKTKKDPYTVYSDIYSLGVLLWEISSGQTPFEVQSDYTVIPAILSGSREERVPETPDKYYELYSECWNDKPEKRCTITHIYNVLSELLDYYKTSVNELEEKAKEWVYDIIEKKIIKLIAWSEFKSDTIVKVGGGNFGSIIRVYWTNIHNNVVCKQLTNLLNIQNKVWEAFKQELQIQSRVDSCENIIRVLGISKDDKDEHYIVMEYADEGDLNDYLSKHFENLDWNRKLRLALDITTGLYFLHKEKILHRDLHAKNVVIHQGKAKITDFGYSKSMDTETIIHNELFGNIRYVAPEILKNETGQDPYTIYSDIYSLGILLWEISSGKNPSGFREERVPGTPDKYYELYSECWNDKPEKRCTIEHVYNVLSELLKNYDDKKEIEDKKVDDVIEIDKDDGHDDLYLDTAELIKDRASKGRDFAPYSKVLETYDNEKEMEDKKVDAKKEIDKDDGHDDLNLDTVEITKDHTSKGRDFVPYSKVLENYDDEKEIEDKKIDVKKEIDKDDCNDDLNLDTVEITVKV